MNFGNGKISERQCFRIGLLENIAIPMIVIPFVTIRVAGTWHTLAFLLGLVGFAAYAIIMYLYACRLPEGMVTAVQTEFGAGSGIIACVYVLRYALRASFVLLYFSMAAHRYMLRSIPLYALAVPFVLVCGYGALRDVEKRGRLLEFLFWWMITPLILIAVFAVSNADWSTLGTELFWFAHPMPYGTQLRSVWLAAYFVVIITSGIELMMYTIVTQKKNRVINAWKILTWIGIALVLSYVFILGILGKAWVSQDSLASLNVMEAASVPGGLVKRMDYAVLAFWIIGIFAVMSGYLYYAKQYACGILWSGGRQETARQRRARQRQARQNIHGLHADSTNTHGLSEDMKRLWEERAVMAVILALVVFFMWCWQQPPFAERMGWYMIRLDLFISLLLPFVTIALKRNRLHVYKKAVKTIILIFGMFIAGISFTGCGKRYESSSLENRDYVLYMTAGCDRFSDKYQFWFEVADLTEYDGDGAKKLQTDEYVCTADSIEDAIRRYYDETKQQLDLGHLREITFAATLNEEATRRLIAEFADMPFVPKSVPVHSRIPEQPDTAASRSGGQSKSFVNPSGEQADVRTEEAVLRDIIRQYFSSESENEK